jgi:hypothetical protein
MSWARTRIALTGAVLLVAIGVPLALWLPWDEGLLRPFAAAFEGFRVALASVGWVLIPQIALAVAVGGAALQAVTHRLAGLPSPGAPRWIDPAVESALLLGMVGTLSGMVDGFVGLSPDELEPGPLVHGLGTALRSSLVGFSIALVGVWVRAQEPIPLREWRSPPATRANGVELGVLEEAR